jgi:hypothetical protein
VRCLLPSTPRRELKSTPEALDAVTMMRLSQEHQLTIAGNAMMDPTDERAQRGHFMADVNSGPNDPRTIPIIQTPTLQTTAPSPSDPMEVTPSPSAMAPPDTNGVHEHMGMVDQPSSGSLAGPSAAAAAAAGAQQPKVVQTAFIHKLYK